MSQLEFTSQDLQKRSGEIADAALLEPVSITYHGRRRLVIMSTAEYERLQKAAEPRVYTIDQIPDDLLEDLAGAKMSSAHAGLDDLLDD
jgi:prevent-host-death family protein